MLYLGVALCEIAHFPASCMAQWAKSQGGRCTSIKLFPPTFLHSTASEWLSHSFVKPSAAQHQVLSTFLPARKPGLGDLDMGMNHTTHVHPFAASQAAGFGSSHRLPCQCSNGYFQSQNCPPCCLLVTVDACVASCHKSGRICGAKWPRPRTGITRQKFLSSH